MMDSHIGRFPFDRRDDVDHFHLHQHQARVNPSRCSDEANNSRNNDDDDDDDDDDYVDPIARGLGESPVSDEIVTEAPAARFRLTTLDVVCLVLNRMIGSGIFMTPHKVMAQTQSTGVSLLFWFAGVLYALAGMHIYIEYGLNVPRVFFGGREQSVPRSGGDLNYLQYVYRWLGYRGQTVLPITCLFGITFIMFGNMAGNCMSFAIWIVRAAGHNVDPQQQPVSDGAIRGIALSVATLSCCIHAVSRRGGLLLNDVLAVLKVMILLLIIVTAVLVAAAGDKVFPASQDHFSDNMNIEAAFEGASSDAHNYASAFLSIIFTYSGFEQPNYVLGEIGRPRQRFPRGIAIGTIISCILYMVTNIAYMVVVPKCAQIQASSTTSVAEQFFNLTYGHYHMDPSLCYLIAPTTNTTTINTGYRIFAAFVAISSLGNVIVMTYTAARVKQEIAKNGIIPFAKFFAHNSDVSIGHALKWLQRKMSSSSSSSSTTTTTTTGWFRAFRWLRPEEHMERTPVGALVLHELSCILLIGVTLHLGAEDAYTLLVSLATYLVSGFFGMLLGLGILILRFRGPPPTVVTTNTNTNTNTNTYTSSSSSSSLLTWRQMTGPRINPVVSVVAAAYYTFCNAWTLVAYWVPPKGQANTATTGHLAWFAVPTVSWAVLGVGGLWFLGFFAYAKRKERRVFKVFTVDRSFVFESANGGDGDDGGDAEGGRGGKNGGGGGGGDEGGGLILAHETVYLAWQAKENMNKEARDGMGSLQHRHYHGF